MWKRQKSLSELNQISQGTMMEHLGIVYTKCTENTLEATMPVDHRTIQAFGLLHGGASVVLAETLGSVAGWLCCEGDAQVVGIDINANHVRAAKQGSVRGVCTAIHVGRSHQVWEIKIYDEADKLCCISRLTTAVLDKRRA
ncbi:Esterase YdiI [Pragia fontium]|uniref:1,4-dihydroxy-2-naphthoyl-CoA hydrolase n=2 Tax=Pragia fontium TaxID=82985 RepID=A0AAJ4WBD8_9GAMM|nr:hotdog fold thioesterase [Pragia fontium]AKJ42128.1 thioesterase [Pragia fontium]GKX61827.1 acyl-CoA esterase [Pragia fontium]SFD00357.1 1,4-dihydroxy-2-naphthoyl-CoA hydrolase [Pragia fontium DSM 5563 = ATCC 49100]SUB82376.1 Esterase YdiI [Pragia fontium]